MQLREVATAYNPGVQTARIGSLARSATNSVEHHDAGMVTPLGECDEAELPGIPVFRFAAIGEEDTCNFRTPSGLITPFAYPWRSHVSMF